MELFPTLSGKTAVMPSHVATAARESKTVCHGAKLRATSHQAKVSNEAGYYTLIEYA